MNIIERLNVSKAAYQVDALNSFINEYLHDRHLLPDATIAHIEFGDNTLIFDYLDDDDRAAKIAALMSDIGICQSWLVCAYQQFGVTGLQFIVSKTEPVRTFTLGMCLGGSTVRFVYGE